MFEVTSAWKSTYPEAHAGVLVMHQVANPAHHPELEKRKAELEEQLRAQFAGQDRAALSVHPVLQAYNGYYKRFKKSYHVQLQLESIAWKGKLIPSVSALVEAMFMASFNATIDSYRPLLRDLGAGWLKLANTNFDVGEPTSAGRYKGADQAYDELLGRLADHKFDKVSPELKAHLLAY